jgi:hypothetical protein
MPTYKQVNKQLGDLGHTLVIANGGAKKFPPAGRYPATTTIEIYGSRGTLLATMTGDLMNHHSPMYHINAGPNLIKLFRSLDALALWMGQEQAVTGISKESGTVFVDGRVVGFQFNQHSLGSRTFQRTVKVQPDGSGRAYIPPMAREVKCVRMEKDSRFWKAIE